MRRITLLFTILLVSVALPLASQTQQPESLGDMARELRDQHDKNAKKATKVFTNDNLPVPKFGEAISSPPAPPEDTAKTPEATAKAGTAPSAGETGNKPSESKEDKTKTRDYWQDKFKAARQDVARAKEHQQLAEDELNLLQLQEAREMDAMAKADLTTKVEAKQS